MTKLDGCVGYVMRTSRVDFRSGLDVDPDDQRDMKRKPLGLMEVCAPPSAILLCVVPDFNPFYSQ